MSVIAGATSRRPELETHELHLLLSELQDERAQARTREALWISVILHLLLVLSIVLAPKLLPQHMFTAATRADLFKDHELTFLALPPDGQKPVPRPDARIISDKNRIAVSRNPVIDRKTLEELRDSQRPGAPGTNGQRVPPAMAAQASPPAPASSPATSAPANQLARLEPPPFPRADNSRTFGGGLSAGSAIEQAARAAAASRTGGSGVGGDYGLGLGSPQSSIRSNIDVLSDTMGVDFGPYLSRVLHDVRENWYNLIPEEARAPLMKHGKVSIEFAILRDGGVAGMRLTGPSGDVALDRAAWGGITASNPFPPLPSQFRGDYLALRFHFYYNPARGELQ